MNFYDFFYLFEIAGEDPLSMNTDDIQLRKSGSSLLYDFEMDQETYTVTFGKTEVYCQSRSGSFLVTDNAYSITLKGPEGYKPTGRGKPLTVYKNLIKAVKKLLDQENPEGLQFYGAYPEQDIMYAAFYEKYLSKAYTKLNRKDYLRNTFLEQLKAQGGDKWTAIEQSIEQEKQSDDIEVKKQNKLKQRERRQQFQTRLPELREMVGKIAYMQTGKPVYVTNINSSSGEVSYQHVNGSYFDSDSTEDYDVFKPIDQMPVDPTNLKKLQRLIAKVAQSNYGRTPQFWGTPPEGWDQQTQSPLTNAVKKIAAHQNYGPVYITSYNEDRDEARFKYISGRYLEEEYGDPDSIGPLDKLPPEMIKRLQKLMAVLKRDGYRYELWGTPPTGWDQEDPHAQLVGKIAFNPSYGPVHITDYDGENGEVNFYYIAAGRRHLDSAYASPDQIEKIDAIPDDQEHYAQLRKLVRKLQQNGNEIDWYGTPPTDYDQYQHQTHEAEGKIAYSYDYGPLYVQPRTQDTDENLDEDELEAWYVYGSNSLENIFTNVERLQPIDRTPVNYLRKLRKLVELLRDRGTQVEFYGTPPHGWDQQEQKHPATGKIAFDNMKGPILVHDDDLDDDDQLAVTYWSPTYNRIRDGYVDARNIQPLDRMTQQWARSLQQLIDGVTRSQGHRPELYGNPPEAPNVNASLNKIAYSQYYEMPVFVQRISGNTVYVLYMSGNELREFAMNDEQIQSWDEIDGHHSQHGRSKLPALQQALQQQGTQTQLWTRNNSQPATPQFET